MRIEGSSIVQELCGKTSTVYIIYIGTLVNGSLGAYCLSAQMRRSISTKPNRSAEQD